MSHGDGFACTCGVLCHALGHVQWGCLRFSIVLIFVLAAKKSMIKVECAFVEGESKLGDV